MHKIRCGYGLGGGKNNIATFCQEIEVFNANMHGWKGGGEVGRDYDGNVGFCNVECWKFGGHSSKSQYNIFLTSCLM